MFYLNFVCFDSLSQQKKLYIELFTVTKLPTPDVMTTDWNLSKTGFIAMEASIQL